MNDNKSADGKYNLVVTSHETKKGYWNHTTGSIYQTGIKKPIFEVNRNYSSFPYLWVDHPNGHQYLICGADYQGQTVLELDTIRRKDFLPPEAKKGHGFCWAQYQFDQSTKILVVCGCVWACPYEFRFYDFSDPMNGWPEIESEDCIEADAKWPILESDNIIKIFQTLSEDEEGDEINPPEWRSTKTFKREGLKLILLNEEMSENEKKKRQDNEESWKKYRKEIEQFKDSDPLFLAHERLIKEYKLSPEDHYGIGVVHENWCPHFKIRERRFCRRIIPKGEIIIDLEWGMSTGPIKLIFYKGGKHVEDKWFDHSKDGMIQAFKAIKEQKFSFGLVKC